MGLLFNDDFKKAIKLIPDSSIDLIATDPPYPVTSRGNAGNSGGMLQKKINMEGKVFENNSIKPSEYLPEFYRVLKDGSHCYVMTNHINLIEILNEAEKAGFKFIKSLIWNKGNKIMGGWYMSQFEYVLFFRKGKAKRINKCGTADIINVPNKKNKRADGSNLHDTEKPVDLYKVLIENSSKEYEFVLDPFMGVGGCGVACQELSRCFVGIELDKDYYDLAVKRLNNKGGVI